MKTMLKRPVWVLKGKPGLLHAPGLVRLLTDVYSGGIDAREVAVTELLQLWGRLPRAEAHRLLAGEASWREMFDTVVWTGGINN